VATGSPRSCLRCAARTSRRSPADDASAHGVPAAPGPAAGAVAGWATGGGRARRGGGTDRRWEDNAGPFAGRAAVRGGGAGSRGGESVSPPLLSGHAGLRLPDTDLLLSQPVPPAGGYPPGAGAGAVG